MANGNNLEERVNKLVVSYNAFPWYVYPVNWAANFPFRKLRGFEKLEAPHRFLAVTKHDGRRIGRIAKVRRRNIDFENIYYRAAYDLTGGTVDPISEWAEDTQREVDLNPGTDLEDLTMNRLTALQTNLVSKGKAVSIYQHRKSFFDSWYGLPFKLPFYLASLPLSMVSRIARNFAGKELIELGKLYEIENLPLEGDIKLDQNLVRQYLSLGLGKYYDIRDQNYKPIAKIKRSPLIKLLSLGLKNRYTVKLYTDNKLVLRTAYSLVDYLQNEFRFRFFKPKKHVTTDDLFRYEV